MPTPFTGNDQVDSALDQYFSQKPDEFRKLKEQYGDDIQKYLDSVVGWWNDNGDQLTDQLGNSAYAPDLKLLDAMGYDLNPAAQTTTVPLEQGILQGALPGLMAGITADAGRTDFANTLQGNVQGDYNATRGLLAQTQGGGVLRGDLYFQQNPDVAEAFKNQGGVVDGVNGGQPMSADQFALWHYQTHGQAEGRKATYTTSSRLNQENDQADRTGAAIAANARTSASSQLAALQASIASMQGNLQGELAARAAALQQQIASLNDNLSTFDAAQRETLATQIAAQQKSLETDMAAQKVALGQQMEALRGASDVQSQAKAAALSKEIEGLTAAQAPMADARMKTAEALTTAINLGLESTKDQLTADQASAGYLGGSSMGDAALARAVVGARQQGAQAIGAAREQNAADTRTIGNRAATEGRVISSQDADTKAAIAAAEANGNFDLAKQLSQGTHVISDFGTNTGANISNTTAQGRKQIGDMGANTTYADTTYGAAQKRSIADTLAQSTYGIDGTLAKQIEAANNGVAQQKQAYFDNDFTRATGTALQLPALTDAAASSTVKLAGVGNAGLNNTLNTLNWWATNSQAPSTSTVTAAADNSGAGLATLGAGVTGAALNYGNANSWWQKPKTATVMPNDSAVSMTNAGAPPAVATRYGT